MDRGDDGCDGVEEDLVWVSRGLGRRRGSLGYDFPGASFLGWPSIRSRRSVGGFLLKPISAWEEVFRDRLRSSWGCPNHQRDPRTDQLGRMRRIRPRTGPIQRLAFRSLLLLLQPQ